MPTTPANSRMSINHLVTNDMLGASFSWQTPLPPRTVINSPSRILGTKDNEASPGPVSQHHRGRALSASLSLDSDMEDQLDDDQYLPSPDAFQGSSDTTVAAGGVDIGGAVKRKRSTDSVKDVDEEAKAPKKRRVRLILSSPNVTTSNSAKGSDNGALPNQIPAGRVLRSATRASTARGIQAGVNSKKGLPESMAKANSRDAQSNKGHSTNAVTVKEPPRYAMRLRSADQTTSTSAQQIEELGMVQSGNGPSSVTLRRSLRQKALKSKF